ncbi:zinc finger dihydrouridine synthase [Schizopora paradoxa]|uniref:tRNA-dihydrouridine(47) synthase [NAD(P)(+)] n=1 Tax=Schizopora paradoxa TaxID=27342 RepID=A0A0H2S6I1_9AGAM|nr:zinc finger dihydrouridine synthase [Schizopora paradoxa]
MSLPPGTAPIKAEFIISTRNVEIIDDDGAENATSHVSSGPRSLLPDEENGSSSNSRNRHGKVSREEKKKRTGANKGRRFAKVRDELELCWKVASGQICERGDECRNTHDITMYLSQKLADIIVRSPSISQNPTGDEKIDEDSCKNSGAFPESINTESRCPIYEEKGECKHGFKCRFLGGHVKRLDDGSLDLLRDDTKVAQRKLDTTEINFMAPDTLKLLRTRKYPRPITEQYTKELRELEENSSKKNSEVIVAEGSVSEEPVEVKDIDTQADSPDVPMRFSEKRRLHWKGLTYLAPLTTVGNLPFRQLCVTLGADITCGEMGLALPFLQGSKEEWSLVRRHPSERVFGIQLAGNKPGTMTAAAETMAREFGPNGIDFVDINCGCPIDLVFKSGSGSALLDTPGKLGKMIVGMNRALGEIPVTVKLRTGVKDNRNTAHKLMPRLSPEWGVGAVTLHGRTRQQRYTKLADWDYIKQCVDAVRAREADEGLAPIPIFGGGDCYSSESYWSCMEQSSVDGIMIGRGALIKPWIFTEIKERREWDISARERLDLIQKYAEFGLNHFGSDTAGVNTTRRYLCEALSFQHRYIPIGLLEVLPGRLNDRPPAFRGRDELETLLCSSNSQDWVKISEMFLGPVPDGWTFTPKHKSNAYGGEEGQG